MSRYIPMNVPEVLESSKLRLRFPQFQDAPAMVEAITESHEELRLWMPWAQTIPTVEESESVIQIWQESERHRREFSYYMFSKEDRRVLGACGVHHIYWDVPRFEIGYWVRTSETGNGYATEATRLITNLLFEQFHAERVEIRCDSRNRGSASVARRAGYLLEACLRRETRDPQGNLRDTLVFARLRDTD